MRYEQFLDIVLGRAKTLRFEDPAMGQVDTAEVELAAYNALLELNDGWDFDAFKVINDNIAITAEGVSDYALPGDFGRLRVPKDERESGLYILTTSGQQPTPLEYRDPDDWFRLRTTSNGTPSFFTTSKGLLKLDPPPDTNGGSNYTIQGVYIMRLDALDDDDPILVSHPTALINATLTRLAIDKGAVQAAALVAERNTAVSKLANNQARVRQQFRPRHINERGLRRGRSVR